MGAEQESAEASGAGDDEEESQEEKESSQEGGEIKSVESVEDEGSEEESEEEIAESGTEGEKRYEEASGEVSEEDEGAKSSEEQEEMEVSSQKDGSDELGSEETNEEQEEEFEESASEEASGEVEEETGEVQSEEGPQENIEEEEDEASEEVSEEEEASEESEEDAGASEGYEEDEEAYEAEESEEAEYEGSEEALADIIEESEVVKKMEEKSEQPKKVVKPAKDAKESKAMPPIPKLTLDGVRKRGHIADALGFASIGSDADRKEEKLIAQILKDIKKSATDSIKPMEKSFKFSDISQRVLGDAEIFNKPMALFLGPWSSGKSTAINYLLGTDDTRAALKTGPQPTDSFFSVIHYNENGIVRESGLKMAGDWAFSGVNKFGQAFLSHFRGIGLNHPLLEKVTIVDTPGVIDGRRFKDFPLEDVFQWFIDRADAIYVVFDPSKLEIGADMKAMLDQLRGKEQQTRFLLNKADLIKASEVTRVAGQLLWNVSPLLGSSDAPTIYTVSMINRPYLPGSPAEYLKDQEEEFLNHLKEVMDERVENTVMYARRHAVRVRNHAKLVDCYLDAFYKHKGMFGNKKKVAEQIIKDPGKYNIFDTISQSKNISRYDLLEPEDYAAFFKLNPLHEFSRLKDLCGFVKGCPIDKLDRLIAYDLPQLLSKYLEKSSIPHDSEEHETGRTKGTVKVPTNAKKIKSK
ncbi:sarcalumenin-like [Tropilaelaps mercedesae]|uniref:Sarcalumenin-like n=1 Tax=Tropilaelaps mercedesae TaxID=418985 RepID=A0A1V9XTH9_9ACAR|nr:sarcalumenin-like [Tropilaelaps mercedesae]